MVFLYIYTKSGKQGIPQEQKAMCHVLCPKFKKFIINSIFCVFELSLLESVYLSIDRIFPIFGHFLRFRPDFRAYEWGRGEIHILDYFFVSHPFFQNYNFVVFEFCLLGLRYDVNDHMDF